MSAHKIIIAEEQAILREGIKAILLRCGMNDIQFCDHPDLLTSMLQQTEQKTLFIVSSTLFPEVRDKIFNRGEKPRSVGMLVLLPDSESIALQELDPVAADGYILKTADHEEWQFALGRMMRGEKYIASALGTRMVRSLNPLSASRERLAPVGVRLSQREKEVLQLVAEGLTNEEIAQKIFASKRTVEAHRMRLIGKTGSRNTATLIRFAVRNGLVN